MKVAYLQIIRICNQNCIFCAQPQNWQIMSLLDIMKQLIVYNKNWIKKLIITWWEPTLHKDFLKIIKVSLKFWFKCVIQTNWNQLSDIKLIDWLKDFPNLEFIISLHSHDPLIHDFLKKSPGSFEKTKQWLLYLHKIFWNKIIIKLAIAINIYNITTIKETITFFLKNFDFINWIILNNLDVYNIPKINYNIVAKLNQFDDNFRNALKLIIWAWKSLNIERIPLCYLKWFEAYSDSLEYILWEDIKYVHYLQHDRKSEFIDKNIRTPKTAYSEKCSLCDLKKYCGWIPKLGEIYNHNDLLPQKMTQKELEEILSIYYYNNDC